MTIINFLLTELMYKDRYEANNLMMLYASVSVCACVHMCLRGLPDDAISSSDCAASNCWIINE
jgi:hypothetical protein